MRAQSIRQSFLGPGSDELLRGLRVGIIGLGGGGSHVAQQLAHVGIGTFVLLDPDRIEYSNLNRLVGGTFSDVQNIEPKIQIASRVIRSINPEAHVLAENKLWQEATTLLRDCDVLFGCLDSFTARSDLERTARRYLIPYIDMGMDVHAGEGGYFIAGQVALSIPGDVCLRCMNVIRDDLLAQEAAQYGAAGGRPQVVWPNGVLASMAVGLMMQLTVPWFEGNPPASLLEYDGNRHEVHAATSIGHLREKKCSHFLAVSEIGDPWYERGQPPI